MRYGESMSHVHAQRRIGIDPVRYSRLSSLAHDVEFHEMTSDVFFATKAPGILETQIINVALVDGLHEFRQALRDVLNLERYMCRDGVIVLDDCNPSSKELSVDTATGGGWNGDVWKVLGILRSQRTDLHCFTIDADQGVGILAGFGRAAPEAIPETVIGEWKAMPYERLEGNRKAILGLRRKAPICRLLDNFASN